MGYHRAGFAVTGVDTDPRALRRYPFESVCADAIEVLGGWDLSPYAVIHASPPCQAYSITRHSHSNVHPDLLPAVREALIASGKPYVIENVPGAKMRNPLTLCGSEFGLRAYDPASGREGVLRRHRLFESNVWLMGAGGCRCSGAEIFGVYGGGSQNRAHRNDGIRGGYTPAISVWRSLMGIEWMTGDQLTQAIPPAYTEHIGAQLIDSCALGG